jgi:DNA replication protein DnaC
MSYDGKIMRRALQRFDADKKQREERLRQREETLYAREPRLREIDAELRSTMSKIITSALRRGTDPQPALSVLRDRNLSLQEERAQLLRKMGLPADCLEEKPNCPLCRDTGYRDGAVCRCLKSYYAMEQQKELSQLLDLGSQSFDRFSLDWYATLPDPDMGISPRRNMEQNYQACVRFAEEFAPGNGNLLLSGTPGLGKTFLSACIAREVSDGGFSVVYDTAIHIFDRFENQKFGRETGEDVSAGIDRIRNCDLLILDDLGTEMATAFIVSVLYEIVNTRLMTEKSTIINTNLSPDEIGARYSPQILSRLQGNYETLVFFGDDIRQLKKQR